MDIDTPHVHGMQEEHSKDAGSNYYQHNNNSRSNNNSSNSQAYQHSEASMNFDYLQGLRGDAAAASSSSAGGTAYGLVDDSRALDRLLSPTLNNHLNNNNNNNIERFSFFFFFLIYNLNAFVVYLCIYFRTVLPYVQSAYHYLFYFLYIFGHAYKIHT